MPTADPDPATLDALGAWVVLLDTQGRVLYANRAFREARGIDPKDFGGLPIWDLTSLGPHSSEEQQVVRDLGAANFPNTYRHVTQDLDGRALTVTWINTALCDAQGRVTRILGTGFPDSGPEDHTSVELLRASEERFQALANNAADVITEIDERGQIVYASPNHELILGVAPRDLVGQSAIERVHPEDRASALGALAKLVDAGSAQQPAYRSRHADGSWRWLESSATTYVTAEGEQRAIAVSRDVTDRIDAEEALRESEQRARDAEQLASVGTLAAGLAHDIGTPMNVILGYAEMLRASAQNERDRERAGVISEQVGRISELISTLLNVARPRETARAQVDLGEALDDSLAFLAEKLRRRRIVVERRYVASGGVLGDANQLQQVFLNLFVNAVDAMPEGGILRVELEGSDADFVEIHVRDNGCGIAPDRLSRIFEPFYTTKGNQGTGLGLVVSRRIVFDHGGTLTVWSEVGRGTDFRIVLPRKAERPA